MWKFNSPGIPDEMFTRGKIPMTKQEIRVVTLAKLHLGVDSVVYDIGAGTGSLSVEIARLTPLGRVFAIEREAEGVKLIQENCKRFGITNVDVIADNAPEGLISLPKADVIFIGGSGGKLNEIIAQAKLSLNPGGRLVLNAVTLETLALAQNLLAEHSFADVEIISLSVTRWPQKGRSHMAEALNPVFIISCNIRSEDN